MCCARSAGFLKSMQLLHLNERELMSLNLMSKILFSTVILLLFQSCFWGIAIAASTPEISSLKQLDLKTAARIALEDGPSIAAAKERVVQAKQLVVQYRASYFPRLDANISYSRNEDPDKISDPANKLADEIRGASEDLPPNFGDQLPGYGDLVDQYLGYDEVTTTYSSGLSASWLIFDGFEREFSYAAAKHGVELNQYSLADAKRLLLGALTRVYLGALLAEESVAISKADEDFNRQLFRDTKLLKKAGLNSLSDVLNFEIGVNYARTRSLEAQRRYEAALYALAALMGLPDARLPDKLKLAPLKTETDELLTAPDINEVLTYTMTHRPDLMAQKATIDISESAVGSAKGQFYPQFYLNASINGIRTDDYSFEGDDFGNRIGIFMTYNLFAGGSHRARVIESKSRLKANEKKLQDTTNNAVASVRSAVTMILSAQEQFSLQQTNAKLAARTRDLVRKEYQAGKASLTRLNEAQKDLITIQGYLAQARVTLRQAWLDMEKESGRILERFGSFE